MNVSNKSEDNFWPQVAEGRASCLDWLVHDPVLLLDGKSVNRSRAAVRTASAGPRPERRVWIDSPLQPVSVRDRPRQTDRTSEDGAGASESYKWDGQPENWLFLGRAAGWVYGGRGTVDLLECAFDGGEVSLFHAVNVLDGTFGGIARHVYARIRPYVGFLIRRTATNQGERSLHNEIFHSRKSK